MSGLVPAERIEKSIFLLRGHKVMVDMDLAELYAGRIPGTVYVIGEAEQSREPLFL